MTKEHIFNPAVLTAMPVFYRTYSRVNNGKRESFQDVIKRCSTGLKKLGKLTDDEYNQIIAGMKSLTTLPSGRWLWVGGTPWLDNPVNFGGAYNCTSTTIDSTKKLGIVMNLAMLGSGTGTILKQNLIDLIGTVKRAHKVTVLNNINSIPKADRIEHTATIKDENKTIIKVGDSRIGWVNAYVSLLDIFIDADDDNSIEIDLSSIRSKGEKLAGFGGVANPILLNDLFVKASNVLNDAVGRTLTTLEACLLIDIPALAIVAGNIRRSAGIRQYDANDAAMTGAKNNMWSVNDAGDWKIDPIKDPLRMANHTAVYHHKPTLEQCIESVTSQFYSGEGAIQWAGEAIARANVDILNTFDLKNQFLNSYTEGDYQLLDRASGGGLLTEELHYRANNYGINPCALGSMKLLTVDGYQTFESLDGQNVDIINALGQVSASKVWCSGVKDTIEIVFEGRSEPLICTPDHQLMDVDGNVVLAGESKGRRLMPFTEQLVHDPLYVASGLVKSNLLAQTLIKTAPLVRSIRPYGSHKVYDFIEPLTHWGVVNGILFHNCGEIILQNNFCNLSEVHLNNLSPTNETEQVTAFKVAGITAASLLHHEFIDEIHQKSRKYDPIVGVSFTGLFDFFVAKFGVNWIKWLHLERPLDTEEHQYFHDEEIRLLTMWKNAAHESVWDYCDRHGLKRPNRCTTLQPGGTKSLLTGASCGWHPPKSLYYIRRITFAKDDPIATACLKLGYNVVPSQNDKNPDGTLLNDPFSDLCTEWLVEIPTAVPWAQLPGMGDDISMKFSGIAQFKLYMQVQKYYTTHNTSATIELSESDIKPVATAIYEAIQNNDGYISAALLPRFDDNGAFPRLPFEPIDRAKYYDLMTDVKRREVSPDFESVLAAIDRSTGLGEDTNIGPAACDSDKCLLS
jgi:hypothetical protein